MYQGTVKEYDRTFRIGIIKFDASPQTVCFMFENGHHIVPGQDIPEFSTRRLTQKPKVGDKVVCFCDNQLIQAISWGYLADFNVAKNLIGWRIQYRYSAQFYFPEGYTLDVSTTVFQGTLIQLYRCHLDDLLAQVLSKITLPCEVKMLLRTFWEKSKDRGEFWEECKDPRQLV